MRERPQLQLLHICENYSTTKERQFPNNYIKMFPTVHYHIELRIQFSIFNISINVIVISKEKTSAHFYIKKFCFFREIIVNQYVLYYVLIWTFSFEKGFDIVGWLCWSSKRGLVVLLKWEQKQKSIFFRIRPERISSRIYKLSLQLILNLTDILEWIDTLQFSRGCQSCLDLFLLSFLCIHLL